jgi:hypothetical protein
LFSIKKKKKKKKKEGKLNVRATGEGKRQKINCRRKQKTHHANTESVLSKPATNTRT